MALSFIDGLDEHLLSELIAQGSLDFDTWVLLISSVEQMYHDDLDKIRLVYDSFLSEFPLCYGYWKRYAEHTSRLCSVENVVQIFEKAVKSAPYSVGVWVNYCSFGVSSFEDPSDVCRLFKRGLSFVGRDYHCYNLWDKYIEYEYSQERWSSLANIYIQTLKFPTKKLHQYYESFKKLVVIWKEDVKFHGSFQKEMQPEHDMDGEILASRDAEISCVVNDLIDPSTRTKALQKYISIGECFYQTACDLDSKIQKFEQNIHRPYFHVKPLDDSQLHTWHQYLDLVEMEGDFDWAVKLYERCLISCALYPEFWMRYVDFVDSKGGREIALDALERATLIFLKNEPEIHLFGAWFKEKIGDVDGAHAAFLHPDKDLGSCFIDTIRRKANMERRMGNNAEALSIYREALDFAADKKPETLPMLYVHFARLQYMITNSVEVTQEVLFNGVQRVPHSKLLLKELLHFVLMHDGPKQLNLLNSIIAQELVPRTDVSGGLSNEDQEEISRMYLEFIDSCGSIDDIIRAWNRHLKIFPHLAREQSFLKKPAKAGLEWEMVVNRRPNTLTSPRKDTNEHVENHLVQLSSPRKRVEDGNSNLSDLKLASSKVGKTLVMDESKANELGPDGKNPGEAVKDSKLSGIPEKQEQERSAQPDSVEEDYDDKIASRPREASLSNKSTPAGGGVNDEILSTKNLASPRDNFAEKSWNESASPSRTRHKNPSSTLSPDHPLEKDGNQRRFNSSGRVRSRFNSPGDSGDRLQRSLSPRRRNSHGYSHDRRHRERSLSPRKPNSRWNSEDRWHRDRHPRQFSRYQDNSRNYRDNRMQNQNSQVSGNKGQTQASRQQSTGSATQNLHPVQSVPYSQAQTNQFPLPSNEQYGNVQNNQAYNQMWQYYYYNQQQQLLQQTSLGSQQQMQRPQQLQQQMQNPVQQQHMQTQQSQQTPPHPQQLLQAPYQQQLYQQSQYQQQQTNEQLQLKLQQQMPLPQPQMYTQQQPQEEQQQPVHIQQQQQPQEHQQQEQQSYQYQQVQQQQYLFYLQQLHQYQQSLQQSGLASDQNSYQQQHNLPEEQQKELPDLQHRNDQSLLPQDDGSAQVDIIGSPQQQDQGKELIQGTTSGAPSDELPEIEGTDE
ncbi:pre-mRNA-processing factor 39-2 isoform X3 [Amaranthus tricolor]|uniref:pre-mRNA-processing factor 39-2 isoform X3 n=1 Tax=Amaranthus tricolor TaxID=29722 RepID=UPI00258A973D|nr:pre-mRNA-processing factor 39-2 isoform X3 [Amaranthus tricolor]